MTKYKTIILILLTINFSCKREQKNIVDKWDNGNNKLIQIYENKDDTLNYTREFYYENGQIGSRGKVANGELDGLWEWWYDNGEKKDSANVQNGLYFGQRTHWRNDGTLKQIEIISEPCTSNCCDGKVIFFSEKGIKLIEYTQRMQNGTERELDTIPMERLKENSFMLTIRKTE